MKNCGSGARQRLLRTEEGSGQGYKIFGASGWRCSMAKTQGRSDREVLGILLIAIAYFHIFFFFLFHVKCLHLVDRWTLARIYEVVRNDSC